ncbi:hypothetical protein HRbin17_01541 [bacterium HR17]|uniref:Flagellar protein FlgJ N-terminal domain-containing protein n=1 Tax=Candidatus Fervidibacter japonicus TaxID=2035412 RepID=A0A2H5XCW1_9BACT|nr:hypothetical protein HRbin17_01541 [bacterium HR17]
MVIGEKGAIPKVSGDAKEQVRLHKVCKDFEAFLVSYLLQQMWRAAESVGGEKPFMNHAYRDLFAFEFARALTPSLRLGVAEALYRELAK